MTNDELKDLIVTLRKQIPEEMFCFITIVSPKDQSMVSFTDAICPACLLEAIVALAISKGLTTHTVCEEGLANSTIDETTRMN